MTMTASNNGHMDPIDAASQPVKRKKKIFTTGQVAKICRVAPRTVSKWFDSGRLKGYRIPGSQDRRIPREQLIRFLKEHGMPLSGLDAGSEVIGVYLGDPLKVGDGYIPNVNPFDAGQMVSENKVRAILVGCREGFDTAQAFVNSVHKADVGTPLAIILPDDKSKADLPPDLFDEAFAAGDVDAIVEWVRFMTDETPDLED